ncbi:MAG: hypothetical protein HC915_18850 [Anaerolineae bacterium]|nr:hypothetical protein [Anaerolineae bacterium]
MPTHPSHPDPRAGAGPSAEWPEAEGAPSHYNQTRETSAHPPLSHTSPLEPRTDLPDHGLEATSAPGQRHDPEDPMPDRLDKNK